MHHVHQLARCTCDKDFHPSLVVLCRCITVGHSNSGARGGKGAGLQVHLTQPRGDVLVFLTGQEEIEACEELLKQVWRTKPFDPCHSVQPC